MATTTGSIDLTGLKASADIATNTEQYFWFNSQDSGAGEGAGAHITELPMEDFIDDPANGGGNVLIDSNSVDIRDGTTTLATFGANGAQIGNLYGAHALIDINGFSAHNRESVKYFDVDFDGGSITRNNDIEYTSTSATKTISDSEITLVSDVATIPSSIPNGTTISINTYYPQLVISQSNVGTPIGVTITQSDGLTAVGDIELRGVRPPQSTELSFSIGTSSTVIDGYVVVDRGGGTVRFSYKLEYDAVNNCLKSTCKALPNNNGQTMNTTVNVYVRINYGYSVTTTAPSYAIGTRTQGYDVGNFSTVIGDNLVAEDECQLAIGKYNDNQSTNVLEIGKGTSDNARSNALTVDWTGNLKAAASLFSGVTDEYAKKGTNHIVVAGMHICWGARSFSVTANTYTEVEETLPYTYGDTSTFFPIVSAANRSAQVRTVYSTIKDTNTIYIGGYASAARTVTVVWLTIGY